MILHEAAGLANDIVATPTPLLAGHTLGGVALAVGAVGIGLYFVGKGVRAGLEQIGVVDH